MGLAAWFFALLPLHVKLYSPCFAVFAPRTDFSILLIEPLNALYYIGILCFVYDLSQRIFDIFVILLVILGSYGFRRTLSYLASARTRWHSAQQA
jgi:hypothetical protein